MLRELLVFSTNVVIWGAVAALVLAYPMLLAIDKIFAKRIGFFRAYGLIFLIDVLAHMAVMLVYFAFGAYRPPVVMGLLPLAVNFVFIVLASLAVSGWGLSKPHSAKDLVNKHGRLALAAALMITVKNILMFWLVYWLTDPMVG